jgi:hypothetical protein
MNEYRKRHLLYSTIDGRTTQTKATEEDHYHDVCFIWMCPVDTYMMFVHYICMYVCIYIMDTEFENLYKPKGGICYRNSKLK